MRVNKKGTVLNNVADKSQDNSPVKYCPFYLRSLNELYVLLIGWLIFFLWTIIYSSYNAYYVNAEEYEIKTIFGFPDWVFWGVFLPWIGAGIFTCWFSFFVVKDDDEEYNQFCLNGNATQQPKVEGSDD